MLMQRILSATVLTAVVAAHAVAATPEEKTSSDGIRYLSGGVGQAEVAAMREAAPDYDLGLVFATREGNYLANVRVTVSDRRGREILTTVTDGPMVLVDLPPGSYRVEASANGRTVTRDVSVPRAGHRQAILRLPAAQESPAASPGFAAGKS